MQTSGPPALRLLGDMAARVAATSVEAGRRKRKTKKRAPSRRPVSDEIPSLSEDVLESSPEYACHVELDITASFEGTTSKAVLLRKVKAELVSAMKSAMTSVARELNLRSSGVSVRPLRLDCDINDA